jgi:hypothetical protein
MNMRNKILGSLLALVLVACGSEDAFVGGGNGGGGGGGGGTPAPAEVNDLRVSAALQTLPAEADASTEIIALAVDANGVGVPRVPVQFSLADPSAGALSPGSALTGEDGVARVTLSAGGNATPRNIVVQAASGSLTSTVTVAVGSAPTSIPVANLTLVPSTNSIPADGSVDATFVAVARDANNLLLAGVPISFTSSGGGLQVTRSTTDSSGQAIAILSTAGETYPSYPHTLTVTATEPGGLTATRSITVSQSVSASSVRMGRWENSTSFVNGQLGVAGAATPTNEASIAAGGSINLYVNFVDDTGQLSTTPVTVNFNSPCVAQGTAEFRVGGAANSQVTTTTGQANITYVDNGCVGTDAVTAVAAVGGQSLSATGLVNIAPASAGSIAFISATPTNIALKGVGQADRPETSTLLFRVVNGNGQPIQNQEVAFSLSTTVGDITLSTATTTTPATSVTGFTDTSGNVQVVVNAGTVATSVRVTAAVVGTSPQISTQSSSLTISTGIPTSHRFSMAVDKYSIDGFAVDGAQAVVTVRMADRFGNPVPDGTAVSFTSENGGDIEPECLTETRTVDVALGLFESGLCSVLFRSSGIRPPDGRVSILATVIGEESFIDAVSDGRFGPGDIQTSHVAEAWLDRDEDGERDLDEPFYDFNNNGDYDAPNDLFDGVLCDDNCGEPTIGLGQHAVIILSDGGNVLVTNEADVPFESVAPAPLTVGSTRQVQVWARDAKGNPLPAGTTIAVSTTSELGVQGVSSQTVPANATAPIGPPVAGQTLFTYTIRALGAGTTGVGTVTIIVTVPGRPGVSTTLQVPVTP